MQNILNAKYAYLNNVHRNYVSELNARMEKFENDAQEIIKFKTKLGHIEEKYNALQSEISQKDDVIKQLNQQMVEFGHTKNELEKTKTELENTLSQKAT